MTKHLGKMTKRPTKDGVGVGVGVGVWGVGGVI